MRRLLGILIIALVSLAGAQLAANADEDDWRITRYDMTLVADRDGEITVQLDFDFDFANERGHGPFLVLPTRLEVPDDPDRWRVLDVSDISATSSTGAPTQVHEERSSSTVEVRIGDENRYVSGVQSYQVTFTVDGVINPDTDGFDEISWNAIAGFELPISNASVSLEGPAEIQRAECVAGSRGSTDPCTSQELTDNRVTWTQDLVQAEHGMTVTAAFPAGTFPDVVPQYAKRLNLGNTLTLTPATAGASGAVAMVGLGGVGLLAYRRGRDRAYIGITPGLEPSDGAPAALGYRDKTAPVAVQFSPPAGVRPAEVGTLVSEKAGMKEISATLVDLAVRGYLRIEEAKQGEDKRLIKLQGPEGLVGYERAIYDGVFAERDNPRLGKLSNLAEITANSTKALNQTLTDRGWFRSNPGTQRNAWALGGGVVLLVGAGLGVVLGITSGWGLLGVAIALVGLAMMSVANFMPARTAQGSAVLAQAEGFKLYLTTAEAEQLRFEEGEDIYSKYLPYAIVFGVAEQWTKRCAALAAQGHMEINTSWYVGSYLLLTNPGAFANDMAGLSDSMTAAMTSSMTSAGGSGFGGGVGGGVGGVGGGGW